MTDAPVDNGQGDQNQQQVQNQQPAAPWYGQIEDNDLKSWAENKNFKSPVEAMASYRNLEKVFGADKAGRTVVLPGEKAEQGELDAFYQKLGRPESADKYDLKLPENHDKDLVGWFRSTAHELGFSQKQAAAFLGKYEEMLGGLTTKGEEAIQAKLAEEHASLDKEWGAAKPQKIAQAKAAAQQFGIGADVIDALEDKMGYAAVMKTFSQIGEKLGEGGLIIPPNQQNFGAMTPAQAQSKISELKADKDWVARWIGGDKDCIQQLDDLTKWANAK